MTFRLRPEARWHDGKPVTVEDVIYSFEVLKANSPTYAFYYGNVVKAAKIGEREVKFTFDEAGNRELPQIMGQLPGASETLVGRDCPRWTQARRDADHVWSRRWDRGNIASRISRRAGTHPTSA